MRRRAFLAAAALPFGRLPRWVWAEDLPRDVKITRVVSFNLPTRRSKFVGKNSRRDDHGTCSSDRVVRLFTSAGMEGVGPCGATQEQCSALLGKSVFDFYQQDHRRMAGPFQRQTAPLWDLAGKLLKKPVYELLGGAGPKRVPVYDGSIYFSDLIPEHAQTWEDRFKQELDMGLARGHRAFKIKIGRGAKWMPKEDGYARDVAVLKLIRRHVGPKVVLAVDANDGYDLLRTKRLLSDLPDFNFAFIEEMFPITVEKYLDLKSFIRQQGLKTLLADGENDKRPEDYKTWVDAKAVDILQGDMNFFGFEDILAVAAMGKPYGITVAPHNWGSLLGYYLQLHVGRAITNLYRAEQDPLSSPALIADRYEIKEGTSSVSPSPGLGLTLDDTKLPSDTKVNFDLKA